MSISNRALTAPENGELVLALKFHRVGRRKNSGAVKYSGLTNEVFDTPGVLQSMAITMTDSAATVNHSTTEDDDNVFDRARFDCLLEAACTGESDDETIAELQQHLHSHPEAGWNSITDKGNQIVAAALSADDEDDMKHHFARHTNLTNTVSRVTKRILNQSVA